MISVEVQRVVFGRLRNNLAKMVKGIYDFKPQESDEADPKNYPIIIFGEDTISDASTDTTEGAEATVKILVYSASKSVEEAKKIAGSVSESFDRIEDELKSDLIDFISCDVISVEARREDRISVAEVTLRIFVDKKVRV